MRNREAMARADATLSTVVADTLGRGDLLHVLAHLDANRRVPVLWGITLAYGSLPWQLAAYLPSDVAAIARRHVEGRLPEEVSR